MSTSLFVPLNNTVIAISERRFLWPLSTQCQRDFSLPKDIKAPDYFLPEHFVNDAFEELVSDVESDHVAGSSFPATRREVKTIAKRHLQSRLTQKLINAVADKVAKILEPLVTVANCRKALRYDLGLQIRVVEENPLGSRKPRCWRVSFEGGGRPRIPEAARCQP